MVPQKRADWPQVFEQHFNAGDVDAVMELYAPEAHLVARSGETLVGRDAIREVLGSMIDANKQYVELTTKAGQRPRTGAPLRSLTPSSAKRGLRTLDRRAVCIRSLQHLFPI